MCVCIINLIFFAHFVRFSTKMYYFCGAFSKEPRKEPLSGRDGATPLSFLR